MFNWKAYVESYPDLQKAKIDTESKALAHWHRYGKKEGRVATTIEKSKTIIEDASAEISLVGDIMLGTNYKRGIKSQTKYYLAPDVDTFLDNARGHFTDSTVFGNLEGVLMTEHVEPTSTEKFMYKSPAYYSSIMKRAGIDCLSVANNHSDNFGKVGRESTMNVLEAEGIYYAGFAEKPYTIFTKNGIRYGFCACSPHKNTVLSSDYAVLREIIQFLKQNADIVVLSFHCGDEGNKAIHVRRKEEYFCGAKRGNPYELAHMAIDAGVDIVYGHGPHVPRAIEVYKDRFIAYSLGNFATYKRFLIDGYKGVTPIIKIKVTSDGKFVSGKIISMKQIGIGGKPILDPAKRALERISMLTQEDIPETLHVIQITRTGDIIRV